MSAFTRKARFGSSRGEQLPDFAFKQMVEFMPVNVMLCDLSDLKITYVNEFPREQL